MGSTKGGIMVQNGFELSFVVDVKANQCLDPTLLELKEAILKKSLEDFSIGGWCPKVPRLFMCSEC